MINRLQEYNDDISDLLRRQNNNKKTDIQLLDVFYHRTRIDGNALNEKVTIYGNVTAANFESYYEFGDEMYTIRYHHIIQFIT